MRISGKANQWSAFAGDTSLVHWLNAIPWFFMIAIPITVLLLEKRGNWRWMSQHRLVLHAIVTLVLTLVIAWLLTSMHLAPLMHARYLFGVYPLIWIVAGVGVARLSNLSAMGCSTVCLGLLIWTQGTWIEWQEGRFVPWQRQEDWRMAVAWLTNQDLKESSVALAPMWLETEGITVDANLDKSFLVCPLLSVYPIPPASLVSILPNQSDGWKRQMTEDCENP